MSNLSSQSTFVQAFESDPIVAFTLARYPKRAHLRALTHLALDRRSLQRTPGLRFWRLLLVGKGGDKRGGFDARRIDLQRTALFTVWESLAALTEFEQSSQVMQRIQQQAVEVWSVQMQPVKWHGQWAGRDPLTGMPAAPPPQPGPWAILTNVNIRPAKIPAFIKTAVTVSKQLWQQPDLLRAVGVTEGPPYAGSFSLWRTLPAITSFAYGPTIHAQTIEQSRRESWLREKLFARFRPVASWGTWDGSDPLHEFAAVF
jgi:hypothetical protein